MQPAIKNNYEIEVPNDKAGTYRVVTLIIALINAAAFTYLYFNEPNKSNRDFALLGMILGIVAFFFYLLKNYTKQLQTFKIEIAFVLLGIIWFMTGNTWLALPILLFAFLGFFANRPSVIRFNEAGIGYPSFPPKLFQWAEVDFALLKDGVLTIELKNNHVMQFTLPKTEPGKPDEAGFNDFCSAMTRPEVRTMV